MNALPCPTWAHTAYQVQACVVRCLSLKSTLMGFFHNLKLWLSPPKMSDPDFGTLRFIHIDKHPKRSYWEGEWSFPPTGTVVSIALDGDESGPNDEARQFYLGLPARFESILKACRFGLEQV